MYRVIQRLGLILTILVSGCSQDNKQQTAQVQSVNESSGLFGALLSESQQHEPVVAGKALTFPYDHLPHEQHAIEWWYFTANLSNVEAPDEVYAVQYTLFRFNQGLHQKNDWSDGQLYMAHASIHTPDSHLFEERFAHSGFAHTGVFAQPFTIRMDDWQWRSIGEALLPAELSVESQGATLSLALSSERPLVLHGDNGYSKKSQDGSHASYYYSHPFIKVTGSLLHQQTSTQLQGVGWFDHEWTSQLLDSSTTGWDWISMHLQNQHKIMVFRMRLHDRPSHYYASVIRPTGEVVPLSPEQFRFIPLEQQHENGKVFPAKWSLAIPEFGIDVKTQPQKAEQWNSGRFEYYEGAIAIDGTHKGVGFMELTGY